MLSRKILWVRKKIMRFRPLHDRVLVRRVEDDERAASGIIIPDAANEKPKEDKVLAVGPGSRNDRGDLIPLDVKIGDRVHFGKWLGTETRVDGEELSIMKEADIIGVIGAAGAKRARKAA
jgi:chaperonin GroES